MRPPKLIKPYVIKFARQVLRRDNPQPFYVPCSPINGAPYNECFSLVKKRIELYGGRMVLGWALWEWPRVLIEAEFHAIWRSQSGAFLDLSPRPVPFPIPRILFLQDQRLKDDGLQVDNIRKPLSRDKDINRLIQLMEERFRLLNEGDLKHQFGEIEATPKMIANMKETAALSQKLVQRYGTAEMDGVTPPY